MKQFGSLLEGMAEYRQLCQALETGNTPVSVAGLAPIHRAFLLYALACRREGTFLAVTPEEASAVRLCEDLNTLFGEEAALLFPAREFTLRQVDGASREYEHQRLRALEQAAAGKVRILAAGAEAAVQYTIPPEVLKASTMTIRRDGSYNLRELVSFLAASGYQRRDQVEGVCQFAVRGGILDFFPPQMADPVRVEFWGEEVDTLSSFKVDTQRRTDSLDAVDITPAQEVLLREPEAFREELGRLAAKLRGKAAQAARENIARDLARLEEGEPIPHLDRYLPLLYPQLPTVLDHFPGAAVFLMEPVNIRENLSAFHRQHGEDVKILLEEGSLFRGCTSFYDDCPALLSKAQRHPLVLMDNFVRSSLDVPLKGLMEMRVATLSLWGGEYAVLREDLEDYMAQGCCAAVFAGTKRAAQSLADDLRRDGLPADFVEEIPAWAGRKIFVVEGALSAGMEWGEVRLAVLSHRGGALKKKPRPKRKNSLRSISDLTEGDYVVHVSHGIGIFEGIVKREIHGVTKDYIKIRYAGTDMLFVPVTQLDLVTKYIGGKDDATVRLNRLNSTEWTKTRQKVKKAVADMADELVQLYARRMQSQGFAFSPDTDWQNDFERRFPYEETEDQLRCIDEMKHDMESTAPMDRLLCGDVGFGKTEVALRGAFKCVMDSKQCAVLVPTTILAWQHYQTFKSRMEEFPVKVELLSRFRTPKQQAEILKELRRGEIDVIIGTHRLVQKDVQFKDLGLVIIDEEQRFGVAHKERFKELRSNVDVLTLSATPIPRTLNMAMSGIRDMSIIEEAPQDRVPVQTYVMELDWGVVRQAIQRELRRGGQVFYLHNRVDTIDQRALMIQDLVPEARIMTAHGKMGEEQLSQVWRKLLEGEIDILVCTTIIETGVDVANCNTLIIEDADRMGLSQLYQIRGRVGRSTRRAYAYMLVSPGKAVSDVAAKRLAAIREFTTFGSGFRIAMRDLEIRGAGNILGAKQHGHMEAVGYEMYLKMLSDAIAVSKGEVPQTGAEECLIDIRIEAHIPESYIANLSQRIDVYKKIASIQNDEDARDLIDELIDRFGEPPRAVQGLVEAALLRGMAARMGVKEITQREELLQIVFEHFDLERAGRLAAALKGRVLVNAGSSPSIAVKVYPGEEPVEVMGMALRAMDSPPPPLPGKE